MHAQPSTLPAASLPAGMPLARMLAAALLLAIAAALGMASVTRAADPRTDPVDTTDGLAGVAEPIVDVTIEVADSIIGAFEPVSAGIEPIVQQLEPTLDSVPPVLESGPLAGALAPVVNGVKPIIDATEPRVRTVDPIIGVIDGYVPAPPGLPVLDAGASEASEASADVETAPPIPAIGTTDPAAVRVVAPPSAIAAFLPHPGWTADADVRRVGALAAVAGVADAGALAVAGSSIGAAILLALLVSRPSSWRAWLPDAHGPPSSRTLTVPVPPG